MSDALADKIEHFMKAQRTAPEAWDRSVTLSPAEWRVVCVALRAYVPSETVIAAMRAAREALANCYDVQSYPGDGKTVQDGAIAQLDAALSSCEVERTR
jgi:hypothetical protein